MERDILGVSLKANIRYEVNRQRIQVTNKRAEVAMRRPYLSKNRRQRRRKHSWVEIATWTQKPPVRNAASDGCDGSNEVAHIRVGIGHRQWTAKGWWWYYRRRHLNRALARFQWRPWTHVNVHTNACPTQPESLARSSTSFADRRWTSACHDRVVVESYSVPDHPRWFGDSLNSVAIQWRSGKKDPHCALLEQGQDFKN